MPLRHWKKRKINFWKFKNGRHCLPILFHANCGKLCAGIPKYCFWSVLNFLRNSNFAIYLSIQVCLQAQMSNKNQYLHNFYCTVFVNKRKGMSTLNFIAIIPYKILSSTNTFKKKRVGVVKQKLQQKKHTCVCFGRCKQTRASKACPCDTQRIATSNRVLTEPPQFQKRGSVV